MENKAYLVANPLTPSQAIAFDPELCIGCNQCIEYCRSDVMVPNPIEGEPPIVLYPDECWFGGSCMEPCPIPGAIEMEHPLNQRVGWKRKDTGEYYRIGMKDPPPPNTRAPVGGWRITPGIV